MYVGVDGQVRGGKTVDEIRASGFTGEMQEAADVVILVESAEEAASVVRGEAEGVQRNRRAEGTGELQVAIDDLTESEHRRGDECTAGAAANGRRRFGHRRGGW